MWIVAFLKLLLTLASTVAKYASDKQLLEAGEARAINQQLTATLRRVEAAHEAIRNMPDVESDPANRDNQP